MATQNLQDFLVAFSSSTTMRAAFDKNPDAVMTEAQLSPQEKELVLAGDADRIRAYLGDDLPAVQIKFVTGE